MRKRTAYFKDRLLSKKWLVILIVGVILTVFGRVIDNKALTQSGIVVGIGIDYRDNLYDVTIQAVAVDGGAGSDKGSTNFLTYSAKGKTISDAVNSLSEKLGLIVSLSHCNLVIMTRSALALEPVRTFSALTKPLALPEQALVVATDMDIGKVFASKIPSTENVSFFLQSVLLQNLGAGGLTSVSVKDYLAMRCSRSGGVMVPYLELYEMTDKPISSQPSEDKNYVIDLNKNLVINDKGDMVIDETTAKSANMFLSKDVKDKIAVPLKNGGVVEFRVIKVSSKTKVEGMKVVCEMKMNVSFVEAQGFDTPLVLNCNSPEVLDAKNTLEQMLADDLESCFLLSKQCGIDFLGLENLLYQKHGRHLPQNCFDQILFEASYSVTVTENS